MNELVPIVVVYTVFYFVYQTISLYARRAERRSIIDKLGSTSGENNAQLLEHFYSCITDLRSGCNSLKIGLLMVGIGLGFVVGILMSGCVTNTLSFTTMNEWELRSTLSLVWIASAAVFGGVGLLIAALIESKCKKGKCKTE